MDLGNKEEVIESQLVFPIIVELEGVGNVPENSIGEQSHTTNNDKSDPATPLSQGT